MNAITLFEAQASLIQHGGAIVQAVERFFLAGNQYEANDFLPISALREQNTEWLVNNLESGRIRVVSPTGG